MKKAKVWYILRISLTLLIVTGVVAAALAVVNRITAPMIQQANERKVQEAVNAVLPGGGEPIAYEDDTGLVEDVYASDIGFAVQVVPSGFNGEITMMVGIDAEGKILGISIVSHTETASLGAVAASENAKGETFRNQFVGMTGPVSVRQDGGQVDAITGATVTSRSVCEGINAALDCVAKLKGEVDA